MDYQIVKTTQTTDNIVVFVSLTKEVKETPVFAEVDAIAFQGGYEKQIRGMGV